MKLFKWIISSLSLYSRIPMPSLSTDRDEGGRQLMFLPLVGVIIAIVSFYGISILSILRIPISAKALIAVLIPLIITGGFHFDGYMDTKDALFSYASKEKKLEIMKDPHIGSFAVIKAVSVILLMTAALTVIISIETTKETPVFVLVCGIYVVSRALAGLTSLFMKKAKPDGMLAAETENSDTLSAAVLIIWLTLALCLMAYIDAIQTGIIVLTFVVFTFCYRRMVDKNFDGVTGDTAGYYIVAGEVVAVTVLALAKLITVTYFG